MTANELVMVFLLALNVAVLLVGCALAYLGFRFARGFTLGAIAALFEWWDREVRP